MPAFSILSRARPLAVLGMLAACQSQALAPSAVDRREGGPRIEPLAQDEVPSPTAKALAAEPSPPQEPGDDPSAWHSFELRRDNFSLTLEWPRSIRQGQASPVRIGIAPLAPWHVNLDYPMSLEIEPNPAFSLDKHRLSASDAVQHAEKGSGFELALTPSHSGPTALRGRIKFAVCAASECMPVTVPVTVDLDVGAV